MIVKKKLTTTDAIDFDVTKVVGVVVVFERITVGA